MRIKENKKTLKSKVDLLELLREGIREQLCLESGSKTMVGEFLRNLEAGSNALQHIS